MKALLGILGVIGSMAGTNLLVVTCFIQNMSLWFIAPWLIMGCIATMICYDYTMSPYLTRE